MRIVFVAVLLAGAAGAAAYLLLPELGSVTEPEAPPAQSAPALAPQDLPAAQARPVAAGPATAAAALVPAPPVSAAPTVRPAPAQEPSPPVQRPASAALALSVPPAVRIQPPRGLEAVAFGMSPEHISANFPPNWTREQGGELMLVHRPDDRGTQVRFHFGQQGLVRLELVLKAPAGEGESAFYKRVRNQYMATYGSLPGSPSAGWNDGQTILQVTSTPQGVSVAFRPAR